MMKLVLIMKTTWFSTNLELSIDLNRSNGIGWFLRGNFFVHSAFRAIWKSHSMNKTERHGDMMVASSKLGDEEVEVYNLNEGQLWTRSELEEMRKPKYSHTQTSSSIPRVEGLSASKKKALGISGRGASSPDFYHGVGPFNDVDLPGVWFFRIPHKVCTA